MDGAAPLPKVLLVDDVEANLVALEMVLQRLPCTTFRATSGERALRLLGEHEFAVLVLDVQMPGMDGFEVARRARTMPASHGVPILFVTGMNETPEVVFEGYHTGAVDLLFKPLDAYVLESKVAVFLDLYRTQRELAREVEAHRRTLGDLEAYNYSVAHDLRAPLRALSGFSQILLDEHAAQLIGDAADCVIRIHAAARRMDQLIQDLLRLAQIGRAAVRVRPLDFSALADAVAADVRAAEPSRDAPIAVEPGMKAQGDERLLRILLENLLRNAWRFTSKKPGARIEVGVRADGDGCEIDEIAYFVRDDGAGFDSTRAERLFQPFQRLHSGADFEGTGIGLAIVKRIVDHHGGRIWAEARVDQGAAFYFTLSAPRLSQAKSLRPDRAPQSMT
jgi:signal transduction histidine kinase